MNIIATEMYGAKCVEIVPSAQEKIDQYKKQGYNNLPICMAKTALSLTGDPSLKGAPSDFIVKINDISLSVGAGFIVPICGEVTLNLFNYLLLII